MNFISTLKPIIQRLDPLLGRTPEKRRTRLLQGFFALLALLWLIFLARNGWLPERSINSFPAEGRWPKTEYFVSNGWMWAAWASLPFCLGGILAAPWLTKCLPAEEKQPTPRLQGHFRWSFPLVALLSVLLSLWIGLPRMTHSLWGDESETFRQAAIGGFSRSKTDGQVKFRERSLMTAAYHYKDTNNHQLYAVLGRFSHQLLGGLNEDEPSRPYFTVWKYRLPALLASLSTIFLLGWLLVRFGLPHAALLVMPLLALQPWFVRYGTEARGYSLSFALCLICLLFLLSALRKGRRRDWIGFGLLLSLQALAYLGYGIGYVLMGVAALGAIFFARRGTWLPQLGGLSLAAIMALLLWMPAFFPCLPGLTRYFTGAGTGHLDQEITSAWVENELALFSLGTFWHEWDNTNPNSITLAELPLHGQPLLWAFYALLFLGALRLSLIKRMRWLILPLLLTAPLTFLIFKYRETYLYPWYLVPAVPHVLAFVALGLSWPLVWLKRSPEWLASLACLILTGGLAVFYGWVTHPQRDILRRYSLEPIRESTEFMRTRVNPFLTPDEDVLTIGIWAYNKGYDEHRFDIKSVDQLEAIIKRARLENKRLYADIGQVVYARVQKPELMAYIDNQELFEQVAIFWSGQDVQNTRVIFQLRPEEKGERE